MIVTHMIAALYARVSTAGQEKEQTINSQIAEIEERAKLDGNCISDELKFTDDGWSGSLLARPGLDKLRDAIKTKAFDMLYLYDFGRLSRDFVNQLILKREMIEAGIQIISIHDINGTSPESQFAQNVLGLSYDMERIRIIERFRRGKLYKSDQGILFGWEAPYGYKYIKKDGNNPGHFEIDDHESSVVKMIYSWVGKDGLTVRKVIKKLYELGISPRKSKKGYWSTSTLSKRLRDQTYIGTTYYNKTISVQPQKPRSTGKYKRIKKSSRTWKERSDWKAIAVPAIIEIDLFNRVQHQLAINNTFAMRNKKNQYLLSNVICCTCGHTRAGEGISGTQNLYYRCTDRIHRFPLPKQCFNKGVNAPTLDETAWKRLNTLLSDPKRVKKYYERWINEKTAPGSKPDIADSFQKNAIQALTEQDKRYLQAYGSGAITLDQYKEQSRAIKLKIQAHTSKLSQQTDLTDKKPFVIPDFKAVCDKINTILDKQVFEKRRRIIQKLSIRVVTDGVTATMTGRLPITPDTDFSQDNIKYEIEYRDSRPS